MVTRLLLEPLLCLLPAQLDLLLDGSDRASCAVCLAIGLLRLVLDVFITSYGHERAVKACHIKGIVLYEFRDGAAARRLRVLQAAFILQGEERRTQAFVALELTLRGLLSVVVLLRDSHLDLPLLVALTVKNLFIAVLLAHLALQTVLVYLVFILDADLVSPIIAMVERERIDRKHVALIVLLVSEECFLVEARRLLFFLGFGAHAALGELVVIIVINVTQFLNRCVLSRV